MTWKIHVPFILEINHLLFSRSSQQVISRSTARIPKDMSSNECLWLGKKFKGISRCLRRIQYQRSCNCILQRTIMILPHHSPVSNLIININCTDTNLYNVYVHSILLCRIHMIANHSLSSHSLQNEKGNTSIKKEIEMSILFWQQGRLILCWVKTSCWCITISRLNQGYVS